MTIQHPSAEAWLLRGERIIAPRLAAVAFYTVLIAAPTRSVAPQTVASPAAASTQRVAPDRVRGRVTDDSGRAVIGASVHVMRGPDRLVQQTTTDSAGRFAVIFAEGSGDYLVAISYPGFRTARRRVQRQAAEHELVADFVLGRDLVTLAAVEVRAQRPVRATNYINPVTPDPGSSEQWSGGVEGRVPPALAGDLAALVGTLPGVTVTSGGPSILGVGSESNLTTLNGMGMGAESVPRAARTELRVTGTTYDPTRGGFSGANLDVRLERGSSFEQRRNAYLTVNVPQLQITDAVDRQAGTRSGGLRASVGADGELIRRALVQHVALDVSRYVSDAATLLSADEPTLLRAGIAPDSVARLIATAGTLGLPLSGLSVPAARQRDAVAWLGRLDDIRDSLHLRTFTSYVGWTREGALGFSPVAAPSAGAERRDGNAGGQLVFRDFVRQGRRVLTETRLSASEAWSTVSPYRSLPGGTVLVRSAGGGSAADDVTGLSLGGGITFARDDRRWSAEVANETIWNASGTRHRFKALVWSRADGLRQRVNGDRFGGYTFNSIADLAAGRAASYSRLLGEPERSGMAWNAAAALAHQYAPSRFFSVLYGARLEGSGFGAAPPANATLERTLGVRTGSAPTRVHVSPRLGFTYAYNRDRDNVNNSLNSPIGRFYRGATGVIRGGVGEFRDLLRPNLLGDARANAGLPGGAELLSCVGVAVPLPEWSRFLTDPASVPTRCADGTEATLLSERAPAVTLIDPGYDVPRSWRASLEWNTNVGAWMVRVSSLVSYDLSQPGIVDVNFSGVPRFTLVGERGRPVFVSPAAIDATTGAVSAVESRRSSAFGPVWVRQSDLRGYGGQLTVTVAPDFLRVTTTSRQLFASASYTLQGMRRQFRGFDGAAFGDPRVVEWAAGRNDARHVLILQGGFSTAGTGTVTLFARAQSGLPFTPLVRGDVNGDGRPDDRAVVPDVATGGGDSALATQLQALLTHGSAAARSCLVANARRVPMRNGCRAPWTQSLNLQWRPPIPRVWAGRVTAAVYLQNVLGGIDRLIHGTNLRGWGTQSGPDPVLLVPRAFDSSAPAGARFRYDVNPRFGDTRVAGTLGREPFRVSIDFSLNLAPSTDLQRLRRALDPVRLGNAWQRRSADSLAAFYLRSNTSDVYREILAESDSLFLTPAQETAIRRADSVYSARVLEIYVPLGRFLATLPAGAAPRSALDSVNAAQKAYWPIFWEQPEIADSLLTPTQRNLLPTLKELLSVPHDERSKRQSFFGYPVTLPARRPADSKQ